MPRKSGPGDVAQVGSDVQSVRVILRLQRALTLARLGQHAKASAEADALAPAKALKGETLYTLARVYALSVAAMGRDGQEGLPPPPAISS